MIQADQLSKRFYLAGKPFFALRDISFLIEEGDFISISGASGSGKTTLLNIIAGILKPTSGRVVFNETVLHRLPDRRLSQFRGQHIGFVYQSFNLIPQLTVYENVRAPLLFDDSPHAGHRKRVEAILERMGIEEKRDEYPLKLSGGQLQRAAIARAVIKHPHILMADEPTGNLDRNTGQEIISLFQELNREGITVLVVSHDPRFDAVASRHMVLDFGSLVHNKAVQPKKGTKRKKTTSGKKATTSKKGRSRRKSP